jgi:hypothetical protein
VPHFADNLEMSLQVHAGRYVEMYLHNTVITPEMFFNNQKEAGDIPANYRIMLDSGTNVYAQKRLPGGSTWYQSWPTGSTDATLKLRVFNGKISFLTGDTIWDSENWDPLINRNCYLLIDGWGYAGQTNWVDNFWIRKYVEPEPAHGAWGSEEVNSPTLPTLASLSPSSAVAGGASFTLTVTGTNFITGSIIRWNGVDHSTTYVSATQLTTAITASDIATPGSVPVTVYNPAPGGGTSGALTFTISSPNPVPTLASLSPSSAVAGGADFTLTVTGTNFITGSVVRWNGADRATTFVSSTQVTAAIPASDIALARSTNVTVFNPTPGGGTSNAVSFTIQQPNPIPIISTLSPNSAVGGGGAFTLTVTGSNFINGSVVRWNGSDRNTTYVSPIQVTASITAVDIATAGTANVTVFNPSPGGGTSNTLSFNIQQPGNPVPSIGALSPAYVTAGSPAFTLTITGANFVSGSVVLGNGWILPTTFVSSTQLRAAISGESIIIPRMGSITVFNPAPGGGISNALNFEIR